MAKKKTTRKKIPNQTSVEDYRHGEAKRKNNPPAKLAAEGTIPIIPKAQYAYSPRRPPVLRFVPDGGPDKLPELLEAAKQRPLADDEAKILAEALRDHEPWLEWAEKREQHHFPDRSAWDKLARALKGVVDEDAFENLSGTVSLPFSLGKYKCVVVKVIDQRGNEVMKMHRF
ncbi:MAG: hypothetical protein O3B01_03350 [Planctomycetota bacterium]|nr:hypothetical protein [Planctomycetota bacterium]MDA1137596.1 hypothetical protein [Planctomycetota bacterium]